MQQMNVIVPSAPTTSSQSSTLLNLQMEPPSNQNYSYTQVMPKVEKVRTPISFLLCKICSVSNNRVEFKSIVHFSSEFALTRYGTGGRREEDLSLLPQRAASYFPENHSSY